MLTKTMKEYESLFKRGYIYIGKIDNDIKPFEECDYQSLVRIQKFLDIDRLDFKPICYDTSIYIESIFNSKGKVKYTVPFYRSMIYCGIRNEYEYFSITKNDTIFEIKKSNNDYIMVSFKINNGYVSYMCDTHLKNGLQNLLKDKF